MKQLLQEFNLLAVVLGAIYLIGMAYVQQRDEAELARSPKQQWCSIKYSTYTETRPCTIESELPTVASLVRKQK